MSLTLEIWCAAVLIIISVYPCVIICLGDKKILPTTPVINSSNSSLVTSGLTIHAAEFWFAHLLFCSQLVIRFSEIKWDFNPFGTRVFVFWEYYKSLKTINLRPLHSPLISPHLTIISSIGGVMQGVQKLPDSLLNLLGVSLVGET